MDTLRDIIAKINTQLADLTASQRLVIGLCAVVVGGSFLWLARWSAEPEYVLLLEEPMTTEQLATARNTLPAGRTRIVGNHIYVLPADQHELFWQLQGAGALPEDTSITFAKLIEEDSPFRPESENHFRRRVALQNELAKVIASSKMIHQAEVFITDASDRRINSRNTTPSASIQVTMSAGRQLDQEMVKACASIVAGAVPGLVPHRVSVIDGATLRTYTPPNPEDSFAQGLLKETKKNEEHLQNKIEEQLSYITGVRVAVTVQLEPAKRRTRELTYEPPAVAEEQANTTETQSGSPSGESGVGPNVGQSLAGGASPETSTSEETKTRFQDQRLKSETTTVHLPLTPQRVTASVGIPWSYVASVVKRIGATQDEPTADEIDAQFKVESARVRAIAKNIIMARGEEDVTVELYPDLGSLVTFLPDGSAVATLGDAGGGEVMNMLRDYGSEGGLALLAIVGLALLSRMARRSARDSAGAYKTRLKARDREREANEEAFMGGAGAVGLAEPTEGSSLEGHEVEDNALRGSEMTRQVSDFVTDNPTSAARLVRRWTDDTG